MSLAAEVRASTPIRKRGWVEDRLEALGERQEFLELLADPTISPSAIWRALGDRGIRVAVGTIYRWADEVRP